MCSKSNPLVVFALDLMSTYEGEYMIFGLLGQANLTQNYVLQFHPFTSARFLIHRAYAVCICALVAILDPPSFFFFS
jgi:hypothetical protein